MHLIKNLLKISALFILFNCIKPYDPQIGSNVENKYVVSGRVTDLEGWQEVDVSKSVPVKDPEYIPVSGCTIKILDDKGNVFPLVEKDTGIYRVWIGKEYLNPGISFKVTVITPENETIESSYDTLMPGAPLDSVYFILEDVATSNPSVYLRGMQFYVDLDAPDVKTRNFKWEVLESWEHHAAHPVEYYYDGGFHQVMPPDSSNLVCWIKDLLVKNVYTLSTKSLSANVFHKYPLHFVDGHTSRLGILYGILVRQLALSQSAYNYWEQVRVNSTELGGLYEKQPVAIQGNLVNLTNPDKEVLGFFYAASVSSRRYFYKDIEGLVLDFSNYCEEETLGRLGWRAYSKYDYPVYYYFNHFVGLRVLNNECVDCRLMGGSTTKPDFWPQ